MQVFLETERLLLRQFTEDDVDNLVELDSDPDVMRYINGGIPTPRAEIEDDILPHFLSYYERYEGYGFWAIIEKSSGEFLGWFHFRPPHGSGPEVAELGYRLHKTAWGQGYATEGSRALVHKGFVELDVQRVVAFAYAENTGSWRVMEKAGLTLVRTFRLTPEEFEAMGIDYDALPPGAFDGDDVEYALERSDWEQQRTGHP